MTTTTEQGTTTDAPEGAGQHALDVLDRYGLLHSFDGPEYEDLIELATDLTGAELATITLVLPAEGVVRARVGSQVATIDAAESFTAVTVRDRLHPTVVGDMTADPRFADNPYVTGHHRVRAYIGVTVSSVEDEPIATVEVFDTRVREWTDQQVRHMTILGRMVEAHFEACAACCTRRSRATDARDGRADGR